MNNPESGEQVAITVEKCGIALYHTLAKALTKDNRIRVEDLISAAAAIVGERCIEAASDFNPRDHQFPPGQRVLSTKANALFCDDKDIDDAPATSIVGILRDKLLSNGFVRADFPLNLDEIFRIFVSHAGATENWGKVPLSIPKDNLPFIMPLRVTYETRAVVDKLFAPIGADPIQKLHTATVALALALCKTRDAIDHRLAITLALETVNGMAKTAPMTAAAMAKLNAGQKSPEKPV